MLSGILPGLGQALNGQRRLALIFLVPSLIALLAVWLVVATSSPSRLLATAIVPSTLQALLILNFVVLGWRLLAVGQAFFDRRYRGRPSGLSIIGLIVIAALVAIPHAMAGWYGSQAEQQFRRVFTNPLDGTGTTANDDDAGSSAGPTPLNGERINVLLMGIDSAPGRSTTLTDSMIVVSVDPVGETVSMVSIPRDMVDVPLGNGSTFAPKINSLLSYGNRHKDEFPEGGTRALQDAIGALLGIPIHYYAKLDLGGFVRAVDAVGGVDINVKRPLSDPNYGGFGVGPGWSVKAGPHHFDGANALAYARIRKSSGENDFTRAGRQQEVLLALRDQAVKSNLLLSLSPLLDALGDSVRTDIPPELMPTLAALAEDIDKGSTVQAVIKPPLVKSGGRNHPYGSVQVPDLAAIAAVAADLFPAPGTPPVPWPTPKPTKAPAPSASTGP